MKTVKTRIFGSLVMALLLITTACLPNQVIVDDTIQIGAILILSGVGSNWGEDTQKGMELAKDHINRNGGLLGKNLSIIYEDNPGDDAKTALSALQSLKIRGIDMIVGTTWSGSGKAVAPVACEEKILMISPSLGVADFNERCL